MGLEVRVPDPPRLVDTVDPNEYDDATVVGQTDYRREELTEFLSAGAWEDAFDEWRKDTEMSEQEYQIVRELELFREFDFFWDDFAGRVGYHSPGIPENWREQEIHPDLTSWAAVSSINAGLTEFGQVVCDVLKRDYVDWESSFDAPDDLPEF